VRFESQSRLTTGGYTMTFRFEEPKALDNYTVVLDNARLRFKRAADVLRAEAQPIDYDFNDLLA
jgi:hypothetical protein